MKSVVTRWEPLAMALNSTPSRSMSLGRHHSSMFPITPTQQGENIKNTQAGRQTLIQDQTVNILSAFHFMLMKQQWRSPTGSLGIHYVSVGRWLSSGSWANTVWWEQGDRSVDSASVVFCLIISFMYQSVEFMQKYELIGLQIEPTGPYHPLRLKPTCGSTPKTLYCHFDSCYWLEVFSFKYHAVQSAYQSYFLQTDQY